MKENSREALLNELRKKSVSALLEEEEVIWNSDAPDSDMLLAYSKVLKEKGQGIETSDPEISLRNFKAEHAEFFPTPSVEAKENKTVIVAFLPQIKKIFLKHANTFSTSISLLLLLVIVAQASGLNQLIIEVADGAYSMFRVSGSVELPDGESADFYSLQEALDAYGITEKIEPAWIPKGYNFKDVKVINSENGIMIIAQYAADSGKEISLFVTTDPTAIPKSEIDGQLPPKDYVSHDTTFHISPNLDQYSATWEIGSYFCSLNGDLSEQEIKATLNSIFKE